MHLGCVELFEQRGSTHRSVVLRRDVTRQVEFGLKHCDSTHTWRFIYWRLMVRTSEASSCIRRQQQQPARPHKWTRLVVRWSQLSIAVIALQLTNFGHTLSTAIPVARIGSAYAACFGRQSERTCRPIINQINQSKYFMSNLTKYFLADWLLLIDKSSSLTKCMRMLIHALTLLTKCSRSLNLQNGPKK